MRERCIEGLGYVSRNVEDLYRQNHGPLAGKPAVQLKPPRRVPTALVTDDAAMYPTGALCVRLRLPPHNEPIVEFATCEWMKWAIVEALRQSLSRFAANEVKFDDILFCMDQIDVKDAQMPCMGDEVWQFCTIRFDYKVRVCLREEAVRLVQNVRWMMKEFEEDFCPRLEHCWRSANHMTILKLLHKNHLLSDGMELSRARRLFEAAQRNDIDGIKECLAKGTPVDVVMSADRYPAQTLDEDFAWLWLTLGRCPLLGAAEEGHLEAMRTLLDAHADVNFQDERGFHALYLGAGAGPDPAKVVHFLIDRDADVNLANESGYTALHNACGSGEIGAVEALLERGGDWNCKSSCGSAPIHVAVLNDQHRVLEALQRRGANLTMPAFGGNTPVHEGVMQNNPGIIQVLLGLRADINVQSGPDNDYATPLRMAIARKKKKAAKMLQSLGALEAI